MKNSEETVAPKEIARLKEALELSERQIRRLIARGMPTTPEAAREWRRQHVDLSRSRTGADRFKSDHREELLCQKLAVEIESKQIQLAKEMSRLIATDAMIEIMEGSNAVTGGALRGMAEKIVSRIEQGMAEVEIQEIIQDEAIECITWLHTDAPELIRAGAARSA